MNTTIHPSSRILYPCIPMADLNKVMLIGRLTRDPQLRFLPSQAAVCDFGFAVGRKFKLQSGETKEETCFIDCTIFGKGGEIFNQYMAKGKQCYLEGRLKLDQWDDKTTGQKRSKLNVIVEDFQFLGSPGDGQTGPAVDVVLMDVRMRGTDGITATRGLHERGGPPVLVLTTFDEDEVLWGAIEAGAAGFVLKEASAEELIAATRAVAGGGSWLDPAVTARVLEVTRRTALPRRREASRAGALTARELDVLRRMATGASNPEIAAALVVSEATVKTHVGSIFAKLGVRDRAGAIVFAYQHGIATP